MNKIFPKAAVFSEGNGCFKINKKMKISVKDEAFADAVEYFSSLVKTLYGIECEKVSRCADIEITTASLGSEEYTLEVCEKKIKRKIKKSLNLIIAMQLSKWSLRKNAD